MLTKIMVDIMKNKYVIIVRVIASIFLIIATYVVTVSIPKIDERIHKENAEIERLKDIEIGSLHSMLNIAIIHNGSRIIKLEINLADYLNLSKELQKKRIQELINDYKVIINNYASILPDSNISNSLDNINSRFETIVSDKNLSIVEKYKQISKIMKDIGNDAKIRHNENTETARKHKKNKGAFEKTRLKKYSCFIWFQIIGLILLGFIEIFEKSTTNMKT